MAVLLPTGFADESDYILCGVEIVGAGGTLAVELDDTPGYGAKTVWDLGSVPWGGVADTWDDDDGKGSFKVKNVGDTWADIYITAEEDGGSSGNPFPGSSLSPTNALPTTDRFALAVTSDMTPMVPSWDLLDLMIRDNQSGRMLGEALAGEYIIFDLKFYAPFDDGGFIDPQDKTFKVGLHAVPHDRDPSDPPENYIPTP
jgi:hypothetical protein